MLSDKDRLGMVAIIRYSHTSKNSIGSNTGVKRLLVTISNVTKQEISYTIDNINEYIEQLKEFKIKWDLN